MYSFGDIREALQRPPTQDAWERLCEVLDAWNDDVDWDEVARPYVEDQLRRWPDTLRRAPWRWVERSLRGRSTRYISVTRRIGEPDPERPPKPPPRMPPNRPRRRPPPPRSRR